jgi:two-component system phosphate regulon sensor histidine kinase PhoR
MWKKLSLLRRRYGTFAALLLLTLFALAAYAAHQMDTVLRAAAVDDLRRQALLVGQQLADKLTPPQSDSIHALCKESGAVTGTAFTVLDSTGEVLADSEFEASKRFNLSRRPEAQTALAGEVGVSERLSFISPDRMLYVAVPLRKGEQIVGVVRASRAIATIRAPLNGAYLRLALAACLICLVGLCTAYLRFRGVIAALDSLKTGAAGIADGDFLSRLKGADAQELGEIGADFNRMAISLDNRFSELIRQRNELEAILSGMIEAVLVVDADERVLRLNHAAEDLFGVKESAVVGRGVAEVIRNTELKGFIRDTRASESPIERDIAFLREPERHAQAHGVTLKDASSRIIGVLIVLHDVTRLKTLERIRRDFVANVSHELRTPVTSIKGFLETLKDGAADDPEDRERFLEIIMKHTDRLIAILDDLLALARIEEAGDRGVGAREDIPVAALFSAVEKSASSKADERKVKLDFRAPPNLHFPMNRTLMEQALYNLVDNAVKYSDPGGVVEVTAEEKDGEAIIRVKDYGIGIEKEHLPRLFERFYRVDKARSRKEGGTGLGLAIARHVANAHGGIITVQSSPGEGSVFTVRTPIQGSEGP